MVFELRSLRALGQRFTSGRRRLAAKPLPPGHWRLGFEQLEERCLLSTGAAVFHLHDLAHLPIHAAKSGKVVLAGAAPLSGTEDTAVSGLLATFKRQAGKYQASIQWGDGQASAGQISRDPAHHRLLDVTGSHLYAREGVYQVTVTVARGKGRKAIAQTEVRVADAPLTVTGARVTAAAGKSFTGTVANFGLAGGDSAADIQATIAWGDGTTSAGTIQPDARILGTFDVVGTKTYGQGGSFPLRITIQDIGGSRTTAQGQALVTAPVGVTAQGLGVVASAGLSFSGPVASFTAPGAQAAAFLALVNWGDGQISAGTIAPDPKHSGTFDVTASNTYAKSGRYPIHVAIVGPGGSGENVNSQATVQAIAPVTVQGHDAATSAGTAFTGEVATFTGPGGQAADYTATITWGDGHSTAGTITPDPQREGLFDVTGTNTYANSGTEAVSVTIDGPGGSSTTAHDHLMVAAAGVLTAHAIDVAARAGTAFTGTVATLIAPGGQAGLSATIDWGDGRTSAGTLQPDPTTAGVLDVTGTHTYVAGGSFAPTVTIQGDGGASASGRAIVTTPDAITAHAATVTATAGTAFSGMVATFTAPVGQAAGLSATINWGDGHSSAGTITPDPKYQGLFDISGTNTYAASGSFSVGVTIQGGGTPVTASSATTVAIPVTATAVEVTASATAPFSGIVATFTAPGGLATNYTATIDWGDSHTSAGAVAADPVNAGTFDVLGAHTYAASGSFPVRVTIQGSDGGGATAPSQAAVANPGLVAHGVAVAATAGAAFSGTVATFTPTNGQTSSFSATIDWGDGNTSAGTVVPDPATAGTFDVTGSNTYANHGSYPVSVLIQGSAGSVPATSQATVAIPLNAFGLHPFYGETAGEPFTVRVATFTAPGGMASNYTATIDWGDGTTDAGTVTPDPIIQDQFDVTGSHTYAGVTIQGQPLQPTVTIHGNDGSAARVQAQISVDVPAGIPVTAVNIAPSVGTPFTGVVATFSVARETAADLSAVLDWGNGNIDTGTVVADPAGNDKYDVVAGGVLGPEPTFGQVGTHPFTVHVDFLSGGTGENASGQATVTGAGSITGHGVDVSANAGVALHNAVVAVLTIPGGQAVLSNFDNFASTLGISMGRNPADQVAGIIQPDPAGGDLYDVVVTDDVTYATTGSFPITVFLRAGNGYDLILGMHSQASVTVLTADFSGLQAYVGQALGGVQTGLSQQVFTTALPLVGAALEGSAATQAVGQIGSSLVNALASSSSVVAVQQEIYNTLGPGGLNVLQLLQGGANLAADNVLLTVTNDTISFEVRLNAVAQTTVGLDAGLDALPLQIDTSGNVQVDVSLENWDLTFGIARGSNTPFLNAGPLVVGINASLPGLDVTGSLGYAQVELQDDPTDPSGLTVAFVTGVTADANGNAILVSPAMILNASLNLVVTATIGDPNSGLGLGLTANLNAAWSADNAAPGEIGSPSIALNNVQLDLGSFLSGFLGPVVSEIQSVTEPLQPVIDFLETPVPILSDLNGGPVTFADILDSYGIDVGPFVNAINTINGLNIDQLSGTIDLGSYDITDPSKVVTTSSADVMGQLNNDTSNLNDLQSVGFDFPILDNPTQVVGLLLGQDTTFFTWQAPEIHGDISYSDTFYPVFDIPIVYVTITGTLSFDASVRFGFDSAGLHSGNLWDGFYVQDGLLDSAGNPILAQLTPNLTATIGVGPGDVDVGGLSLDSLLSLAGDNLSDVLKLDISGSLYGSVNITLKNQDANGVVRLNALDPGDPFRYALDPGGMRFSLGYDAGIHFSYPTDFWGDTSSVDLGPGHVDIGTWELWPTFKQV
jgi:hypothetical protein